MLFRVEWDRLLVAARDGDALALGRLIEVAQDDLQSVASGVLGRSTHSRFALEEVLAEALFAVVKDIGTLRASNYVGFRFWFASVARNHLRRTLRRERNRAEILAGEDIESEWGSNGHPPPSSESLSFVRHVLACMPQSQQVAYVLREGLALPWRTIGFVLDRREAPAARLVHYRAGRRMKEIADTRPDLRLAAPVILA